MASTQTAATAYDTAHTEVLALLDQLRVEVKQHKTCLVAREAETGRAIRGAHVGDMTRYCEALTELLGQLG